MTTIFWIQFYYNLTQYKHWMSVGLVKTRITHNKMNNKIFSCNTPVKWRLELARVAINSRLQCTANSRPAKSLWASSNFDESRWEFLLVSPTTIATNSVNISIIRSRFSTSSLDRLWHECCRNSRANPHISTLINSCPHSTWTQLLWENSHANYRLSTLVLIQTGPNCR